MEGRREADPELTQAGLQQAALLADFLHCGNPAGGNGKGAHDEGGFDLSHLYCSLMVRAVATGTAVSSKLGLPLTAWKDVHEWGGVYLRDSEIEEAVGLPGRTRSYFEEHYPDLLLPEDLDESGWWNRPFEEREERPERAARVLADLLERHGGTDDRVAVVSHGGFFKLFLSQVLQCTEFQSSWVLMNNTAITRFDFLPDFTDVVYVNRTSHLPADLLT